MVFENNVLGKIQGFIDKDNEVWFLASSVCKCLGITNTSMAISETEERLKIAENYYNSVGLTSGYILKAKKIKIKNSNFGEMETYIIPEQFLYELVMGSRKEKAIVFRAWVTGVVLPSLRKHGEYRMEGKLIRRQLTDELQDSGENERMHGHAYPTYTKMIYKSLGLPNKVDRDTLSIEMKEKLAKREDLVRSFIAEGKQYLEIKAIIESNFKALAA